MSARYYTKVSNEMLPHVAQLGPRAGLHLVGKLGVVDQYWTMCLLEDDGAEAWMNGCEVTPTIMRTAGRQYPDGPDEPERLWISDRHLETSAKEMAERYQETGTKPGEPMLPAGTGAWIPGLRPKGDDSE